MLYQRKKYYLFSDSIIAYWKYFCDRKVLKYEMKNAEPELILPVTLYGAIQI